MPGSLAHRVALLLAVATATVFAPGALAQPAVGPMPTWVAQRSAWLDARESRRLARWNEPLDRLAAADRRAIAAESLYRASLIAWTPDPSAVRVSRADLRGAALDLLLWGESAKAGLLLEGVLRDDEDLLPIRAAALGRTGRAADGLALLGWPTDRRLGRGERPDAASEASGGAHVPSLAHLLTAAALAESLGDARAQRAALWTVLASPDAGPAGRDEARRVLARRLLRDGTPRLAIGVIGEPLSSDASLLLGDGYLATADTVGAIGVLLRFGTKAGTALSERYASIRRAADLAKPRADSMNETAHLDLARTLGDVGEADRGLALLGARTRAPSDSAAALARVETEAGLLFRARRYTDAMTAFRRAAALSAAGPAATRARLALGFARAARGSKAFAPMDSAFQSAAALDSAGATGEQAAWERAREWEDQRTPAEAGAIFSWARPRFRTPAVRSAGRVHGAIAERRAGAADSARALLAPSATDDALTAFWRGRLADAAGDSGTARTAYGAAERLGPTSYEGIRAREELTARGAPVEAPPGEADRRVAQGQGAEEGASAPTEDRVLAALGRDAIAVDRLKRCAREAGGSAAITCADALEEAGTFRIGPRTLLPEGRLDYPPAYPSDVLRAAEAESVSAALLWAIMRQESAYDRQARSRAGALGLLQLMPPTASKLAGRSVPADSLTNAALNVRLGARYVRALLAEFHDARAVLASYNAGEEAVRRWLKDGSPIDDEWVERIPFRETRDYVKQVYAAWRRYERLYGTTAADPRGGPRPAF